MQEHRIAWLTLLHASIASSVNLIPLIQAYASAEQCLAALHTDTVLRKRLPKKLFTALTHPDKTRLGLDCAWLEQAGHALVTYDSNAYPELLKSIAHPPVALFVRGNEALLKQSQLAIVGSRKPSKYGKDMAYRFAHELTRHGLTITSGLAAGIDTCAHRGALAEADRTIAVLGHGFNYLYPAANTKLAEQIQQTGLLVSEFPVAFAPLPGNFPRRNRIISGLSKGVLVVEAALKSGSLITARYALEQDREVFAIPGSINNPLANGCHKLIQDGAKLVHDSTDISMELGLNTAPATSSVSGVEPHNRQNTLDEITKVLLDNIGCDPISVDELYLLTDINIDILVGKLVKLELSKHISAVSAGVYIRN